MKHSDTKKAGVLIIFLVVIWTIGYIDLMLIGSPEFWTAGAISLFMLGFGMRLIQIGVREETPPQKIYYYINEIGFTEVTGEGWIYKLLPRSANIIRRAVGVNTNGTILISKYPHSGYQKAENSGILGREFQNWSLEDGYEFAMCPEAVKNLKLGRKFYFKIT